MTDSERLYVIETKLGTMEEDLGEIKSLLSSHQFNWKSLASLSTVLFSFWVLVINPIENDIKALDESRKYHRGQIKELYDRYPKITGTKD